MKYLTNLKPRFLLQLDRMKRDKKIILSALVFLICSCVVVINLNLPTTIITFLLAALAIYFFIESINGLHTGFLERLNASPEEAINSIEDLFRSANSSAEIITGSFPESIYFDDRVFEAAKAAKERGVKIEILIGEPTSQLSYLKKGKNEKINQFLSWVETKEISLKRTDKKVRDHFMVVDKLHVRDEDLHGPRKNIEIEEKRKAVIYYLNPGLGGKRQKKFLSLFEKAKPVLVH